MSLALPPSVLLGVSLFALFIVPKILNAIRAKRDIRYHPGDVLLLWEGGALSSLVLPEIPWIAAGKGHLLANKFKKFEKYGCDVYSSVSWFPKVRTTLVVADPITIKEITRSRTLFPKPVDIYEVLGFFGDNIVVSEGEQWKRYRKITAPAFSDKNNKLVWEETVYFLESLFSEWDARGAEPVVVDNCSDVTFQIAISVLGAAAFGQRMQLLGIEERPNGHSFTFKQALHTVASGVFVKVALPEWTLGFTRHTRAIRDAFHELDWYMREMIEERSQTASMERNDLLSLLCQSNMGDDALTNRELMGNIFIFLIAGHETTAHTLCFALALLALHPNEQHLLHKHIQDICPNGVGSDYARLPQLTRSLAVFHETLRIFPPVTNIPKRCAEDTTLTTLNSRGEKVEITVPKGTNIAINAAGLHYNPRYWIDPHEFKPERFLGDYNKDAFIPFSTGLRSCIGRKFSEVEAVVALSMIVSRYYISVKDEPKYANETAQQRKERVLRSKPGVTVTPVRVPLVFTRR